MANLLDSHLDEHVFAFKSKQFPTAVNLTLARIFNTSFVKNFVKHVLEAINAIIPEKVHPCALYRDQLKFINFPSSSKSDFEKVQPGGDYRFEHRLCNEGDENIFTNTVHEKFKTGEDAFLWLLEQIFFNEAGFEYFVT